MYGQPGQPLQHSSILTLRNGRKQTLPGWAFGLRAGGGAPKRNRPLYVESPLKTEVSEKLASGFQVLAENQMHTRLENYQEGGSVRVGTRPNMHANPGVTVYIQAPKHWVGNSSPDPGEPVVLGSASPSLHFHPRERGPHVCGCLDRHKEGDALAQVGLETQGHLETHSPARYTSFLQSERNTQETGELRTRKSPSKGMHRAQKEKQNLLSCAWSSAERK